MSKSEPQPRSRKTPRGGRKMARLNAALEIDCERDGLPWSSLLHDLADI